MTPIIHTFSNVTSFAIDLGRGFIQFPGCALLSFLRQCISVFGSRLLSLSVAGPLDVLTDYVLHNGRDLQALEHLSLQMYMGRRVPIHALVNALSTFINEISTTLQHLSVWCRDAIDLSDFFVSLDTLPELRSLAIIIPNSRWSLNDTSGLARILANHRQTLQNFELREDRMNNPVQWSFTAGIINCSLELQSQAAFPTNLQTCALHLCAGHYHPIPLQVNGWLSKSLTSLRLSGTLLSHDDCVRLFDAIREGAPALTVLCFHVFGLSPLIFDLLAVNIPGLEILRVRYVHLLVTQYGDPSMGRSEFEAHMKTRLYHESKLRDIGTFHLLSTGVLAESHVMRAIARSFPAVQRFWGQSIDSYTLSAGGIALAKD